MGDVIMTTPPYYPIKDLSDVLAKFRMELELALQPIYQRLEALESQYTGGTGVLLDPELMKTQYAEYEYGKE